MIGGGNKAVNEATQMEQERQACHRAANALPHGSGRRRPRILLANCAQFIKASDGFARFASEPTKHVRPPRGEAIEAHRDHRTSVLELNMATHRWPSHVAAARPSGLWFHQRCLKRGARS